MSSISSGAGQDPRAVERPSLEYEQAVREARRLRQDHQAPGPGDRIPPEVWAQVDFAALLIESRPQPEPVDAAKLDGARVAQLVADAPAAAAGLDLRA